MKLFGFSIGESAEKHIKQGEEHLAKGLHPQALEAFKKALELEPENKIAKEKLKELYRQRDSLKAIYAIEEKSKKEDAPPPKISIPNPLQKLRDRRKHQRVHDQRPILYRPLQKVESADAFQREGLDINISAGGLCIVVTHKIPEGAFLELKFDFPPPEQPVYALGRVVRVETIEDKMETRYALGIRFTNINPKDQKRIDTYILGQDSKNR